MDHRLEDSKAYWDQHARRDPLWAILSDADKRNRGWELSDFMSRGEREISLLLHDIKRFGLELRPGDALDFGCGIGRLTQALGRRFQRAVGVDISPRMIEFAQRINRFEHIEFCTSSDPELSSLGEGAFDFIYSSIVLQHIDPDLSHMYLASFVRLLKPEGLLVFQLPSHRAPQTTATTRPMPDVAYKATLAVVGTIPRHVEPDAEVMVAIEVKNIGSSVWSKEDFGSFRVGNHWLSPAGEMIVQDDGRASLPEVVQPGESCTVALVVKTPVEGGEYRLAFDVVHEGVTWFRDRGSEIVVANVVVGETAADNTRQPSEHPTYSSADLPWEEHPADAVAEPGAFPMHGIEQEETVAIIRRAGGAVVRIEDDDHARPEWAGYRYFVRKSQST